LKSPTHFNPVFHVAWHTVEKQRFSVARLVMLQKRGNPAPQVLAETPAGNFGVSFHSQRPANFFGEMYVLLKGEKTSFYGKHDCVDQTI